MATLSNYPKGFTGGVSVRGLPVLNTYSGNVFWVDSGGASNGDGTFQRPFATLQLALNAASASKGDMVMIKPGHAETISSNTALLFNKAGVAIMGLGSGVLRPTFTLDTANTTTIPVSVDGISIQNCRFIGNFLSIASCFLLTTAAEFVVDGCDFRDTSAIKGFLSIIKTTVSVNSDGLTFTNNFVQSDATTSPGPAVVIANTLDRLTVADNYVVHTVASNNISALVEHGALVLTRLQVLRNLVYSVNTDTSSGAILVKTTATTGSGIIAHNRVRALDAVGAILVTAAAVQYGMFDNLYTGEATLASGVVLPAIAVDGS